MTAIAPKMIILDMDSSVSPTHGEQEGTAYNGPSAVPANPRFLFNQFGDLERCSLRPGNVHSADGWRNVLEPGVMRDKERKVRLYFRGDAAFASPEIYEYLEARDYSTSSLKARDSPEHCPSAYATCRSPARPLRQKGRILLATFQCEIAAAERGRQERHKGFMSQVRQCVLQLHALALQSGQLH